jgi:hypothetical protein
MRGQTLFERFLPAGIVDSTVLHNLSVLGLSLLAALVAFALFALVAMLASYVVSKKLAAGMAGMAILILSMAVAGLLALAVFIVLLATNLRLSW